MVNYGKMRGMKKQKNGIVDLHVHLFPDRMFQAVWKYFESYGWAVHHENVEKIEQTLTSYGITLAVGLSYPHKKGVAESLNLFMEKVGREFPLFYPFASVHPEDENFEQYIDYAIQSDHIFGFKFQPLVQQFDVNTPRLDYLYTQCEERQIPIVMHIGSGPYGNQYVGPRHFAKLMKRFENLRICVPHMGGPEYDYFLSMLDDYPNMFLDTTMIETPTDVFDTRFTGNRKKLFEHSDRICFGSDWPNVPYSYREALDSVEGFGFQKEDRIRVMNENGIRFLSPYLKKK